MLGLCCQAWSAVMAETGWQCQGQGQMAAKGDSGSHCAPSPWREEWSLSSPAVATGMGQHRETIMGPAVG